MNNSFQESLYTTNHSSKISRLSQSTVQEISRADEVPLSEYLKMMHSDPVVKACVDIKCLRASNTFGIYQHTKPEITEFMQSMFGNMRDTLKKNVGELAVCSALGFSVAEINFKVDKMFLVLDSIYVLDLEKVHFKGAKGNIESVVYNDKASSNINIPYKKVLHITNSSSTTFNDPFGSAECKRAYKYSKAKMAILSDMILSGRNLATGILVGKVDSNVTTHTTITDAYGNPMIGSDGKPIRKNATQALFEKLIALENHSVLVTDKNNDIFPINVPDGSQFWTNALQQLDKYIMRSFGVPTLVFEEGSGALGVATLSVKQSTLLDATVEVIVNQIQDQIIEKVCKPIIQWNFGKQKDYGKFTIDSSSDPGVEMQQLQSIFTAISMGIFTPDDPVINNRIRGFLGLPLQTEKEIEEAKALKQIEQQSQMMNQEPQM
jgi:hypothetical protein